VALRTVLYHDMRRGVSLRESTHK